MNKLRIIYTEQNRPMVKIEQIPQFTLKTQKSLKNITNFKKSQNRTKTLNHQMFIQFQNQPIIYKSKHHIQIEQKIRNSLAVKQQNTKKIKQKENNFKKKCYNTQSMIQLPINSSKCYQQKECHPLKKYLQYITKNSPIKHKKMKKIPQIHQNKQNNSENTNKKETIKADDDRQWKSDIINIFNSINDLRIVGYSEEKITQWILNYLQNKKKELMNIFLNIIKKKNLSNQIFYEYEKNDEQAIKRTKRLMFGLQQKDKMSYKIDLKEFNEYMEDILIQKSGQKLKQIKNSIQIQKKFCNEQNFFGRLIPKIQPTQIFNFMEDIKRLEQRYGELKSVSRLNRMRFQQLNETQNAIRKSQNDSIKVLNEKIIQKLFDLAIK